MPAGMISVYRCSGGGARGTSDTRNESLAISSSVMVFNS
jgi:hypothetical protein